MTKEIVKIEDSLGFHYDVTFEYHNNLGFCNALYNDDLIDQCILNKCPEPYSDNDREWEMFEERFSAWKDEMKTNLIPACKEYFDKQGVYRRRG